MQLTGVGVGSLPGESTAAGVDFRTRGRRADEAIDVMRLLWAGGAGGDPTQVELSRWGSLDLDHDGVESVAQQGVSRLVIGLPGGGLDELLRSLDGFASRHELSA